jgi:hypothetical protein
MEMFETKTEYRLEKKIESVFNFFRVEIIARMIVVKIMWMWIEHNKFTKKTPFWWHIEGT